MSSIEKLQKMIETFGEMELDKLCSWFPQENKETLNKLITKSDNLICKNGIVKNKPIVTDLKDNVSYDELLNIIDKYNGKTRKEYENKNNNNSENLELEAIKRYLLEENVLELFEKTDIANIYIQTNKKTGIENYCVITKLFDKKLFDYLDKLFDDEIVIIYYVDSNFKMSTIKHFFTKDANEIIKKYIKIYYIEDTKVSVLKITGKIGVDESSGK